MELQRSEESHPASNSESLPAQAQPSDAPTSGFSFRQLKDYAQKAASLADFFHTKVCFNLEGSETSSSVLGGVITLIILAISFYFARTDFSKQSVTSVDLMDNTAFLMNANDHPIGLNISVPPDADPLLNNVSVTFGCINSMSSAVISQIGGFGQPCPLGLFCTPTAIECTLYTYLNGNQGSLYFTLNACDPDEDPACDLDYLNNLEYINVSLSYYSDQVSFSQPKFERRLLTKQFSVLQLEPISVTETLQLNFYNTNSYFYGLIGWSPIQLQSVRYPESYSSNVQSQNLFYGYGPGDAVFLYSQTTSQTSKQITHNFPNLNLYIAQVTSLFSIAMVIIGYFLSHYENNIFVLRLMSYLHYAVGPDGKVISFQENNLSTVIACLLYHGWIRRCLPQRVSNYYGSYFHVLKVGNEKLMVKSLFNEMKALQSDSNQILKEDVTGLVEEQEEEPKDLNAAIKLYREQNMHSWQMNSDTQMKVFLAWVQVQSYNYAQAIRILDVLFGRLRTLDTPQCTFLREQYQNFRSSAFPEMTCEAYCISEQDLEVRFEPVTNPFLLENGCSSIHVNHSYV